MSFDEARKQCKASEDAYNWGGWLIFKDILNEWVAEGVAFDPHDFSKHAGKQPAATCY